MAIKHYCFISYGVWGTNPGHIRTRQLGAELLSRGIRISYIVDDYPENHGDLGIPPGAEIAFVKNPRSIGQIMARRRILRALNPCCIHVKDLNWRTVFAFAFNSRMRFVFEWDEPNVLKKLPWAKHQSQRFLARWAMNRAFKVLTTTRHLQQYTREKYAVTPAYIPYGPYLSPSTDGPSPFHRPTAVYMGSMAALWDIDLMMDAFRLLAEDGFKPPFTIVGGRQETWLSYARQHGLDNIEFAGYQADADMWRYVRHAHVLIFPIRPTLVNETRCPSKTFVYAQARRPVITSRVGEVAQILGDQGIYVDPTPQAMAAAIRKYMQAEPLPDISYNLQRYEYRNLTSDLLELIESLS